MRALLLFLLLFSSCDADQIASGIRIFDDWVTSRIESQNIPGSSIAIVYKDEVIWKKAYGLSSVTPEKPLTTTTVFPLGGLTKPFTASAIMKLWHDGKINLDMSINKYLPEFAIKGYDPSKRPITPRMLLNHTSGLPQDAAFPYWNDLEFPYFQAIWQTMKEQSLVYPPGTTWKYSNLGYAILGKLVEVASGQDYAQYVEKNFLSPLGMSASTYRPKTYAQGFSLFACKKTLIPFYDVAGMESALGLYSNVEDMSRFASFFLDLADPKAVLASPTRRYMTRSSITVKPTMGYGLGFSIRKATDAIYIEHQGSMPGASTYLSMSPRQSCAIIVMTNCNEYLVPWVDEAARWVFSAIKDQEKRGEENKRVPDVWQKYTGRYTNRENELFVEIYNGSLVLYEPQAANKLDTLEPRPDGSFRILQGNTFGTTNGDSATFHLEDGKVRWLKISNIYLYPQ